MPKTTHLPTHCGCISSSISGASPSSIFCPTHAHPHTLLWPLHHHHHVLPPQVLAATSHQSIHHTRRKLAFCVTRPCSFPHTCSSRHHPRGIIIILPGGGHTTPPWQSHPAWLITATNSSRRTRTSNGKCSTRKAKKQKDSGATGCGSGLLVDERCMCLMRGAVMSRQRDAEALVAHPHPRADPGGGIAAEGGT